MCYFKNCHTIEDLKSEYRKLAKKHHPDLGGDCATMQAINDEYKAMYTRLSGEDASKADTAASDFIAIIEALLKLGDGLTIELCGTWIWVGGNTYPVKEALKSAGFRWSAKKRLWYWHTAESTHKHRSNLSMSAIRDKYGSQTFTSDAARVYCLA